MDKSESQKETIFPEKIKTKIPREKTENKN